MKPSNLVKGSCAVVGAAVLGATALAAFLFTLTNLVLPRIERSHHA